MSANKHLSLEAYVADWLEDPSRREPLYFADTQPDQPGFFHGLIAAITLGVLFVLPVVVFVVALTMWQLSVRGMP